MYSYEGKENTYVQYQYGSPELHEASVTTEVNKNSFAVELPANSSAKLRIKMKLNANKPKFIGFADL